MNVGKRLEDTRKLLEGMELEIDAFEADLQSSCHHTILMGDLNFRTCTWAWACGMDMHPPSPLNPSSEETALA